MFAAAEPIAAILFKINIAACYFVGALLLAICMPLTVMWNLHTIEIGILIPFSISFLF